MEDFNFKSWKKEELILDVTGKSVEHMIFMKLLNTYDISSPVVQSKILNSLCTKDTWGRKIMKQKEDSVE